VELGGRIRIGTKFASGVISADMSGSDEGWFRIQLGSLVQLIILVLRARHFGGRQWYFIVTEVIFHTVFNATRT
jgi:hypothetical protein